MFLAGKLVQGAMRMEGVRSATDKHPAMRHRITWSRLANGDVRQLWESAPVGRDEWVVLFDGLYTRKAGNQG